MRILLTLLMLLTAVTAQATDKLLQSSDLTYLGAFRVPNGDMGGPQYHGLSYGGSAIAYNPAHNSLFIVGHDADQLVAEISIPTPVVSSNVASLPSASVMQNLSDITEGNRTHIGASGAAITDNAVKIGGLLTYGSSLIGTSYAYYDGSWQAVRSHFTSGQTLGTTGDFSGMYQVGATPSPVPQAGYVAGVMTSVPSNWQSALGGPVLTGQGCLSIIGRTSLGPAAFAFDPATFGQSPAPAAPLLYYNLAHPTLGEQYSTSTTFNGSSHVSGVVFPSGTRSVLFTGWHGIGAYCYGKPTSTLALNGVVDSADGVMWCYDLTTDPNNKGSHAYPYVNQVWAYDASDLARVKSGEINPWDVVPYAVWHLDLPTTQNLYSIFSGASAYDETRHILYVVQVGGDNLGGTPLPLVHAYSVNTGTAGTATSPPALSGTISGTIH